ncbi:MAG: hypothetical protein WA061_02165 [Microgenomates group bacterium]
MSWSNEPEKDFMSSLKALMVRYNVKLERTLVETLDGDFSLWAFCNDEPVRANEIYLTLDEIGEEVGYEKAE